MATARRIAPAILLAAALVGAGVIILGRPDPARAGDFFSQGLPTMQAAQAATSLLVWLVLSGAAMVAVGTSAWAVLRSRPRSKGTNAALCIVAGLLLLVAGIVHRSIPSDSMCCGSTPASVKEAIDLAH